MAEHSDRPGYSFDPGPPPEASAYFQNRGLNPSFSWEDVEPQEHATAFTVAKAMDLDVLEAIQGSLQEAIDEGIPFQQWRRELTPRLQAMGWWGRAEMTDPLTGEVRDVQLGSPRRLRTIYRANLRTARAAGQWERIQRTKRALPYLVYLLGPSIRHRPTHEAKEGLVLPVDDPFWAQWFPPNGWGCKCHVRQITRREAEGRGISDSPNIPTRQVFNSRTGELRQIPSGIDPGWETNPGLTRQRHAEQFLAGRLDAVDPEIARVAARDMATSWRAARILDGTANGTVPIAMLTEELTGTLGATTRVVRLSSETAAKQASRHPEIAQRDYVRLADIMSDAAILQQDDRNMVFIERGAELPWIGVVKRTMDGGELYLTTFYRAHSSRYVRRLFERGTTVR